MSQDQKTPSSADERAQLLSASNGEMVYYCPGSLAAMRKHPPESTQETALEGTKIHESLESGDWSDLTEEQAAIVHNLENIRDKIVSEWVETFNLQGLSAPVKEQRFWLRNDQLDPVCSAKPDVVISAGKHVLVLDYKTGYKQLPTASRNIQLRIQALCVWDTMLRAPEHIRVATVHYRFGGQFSSTDYNPETLQIALNELQLSLWRAQDADAPRVPGHWCQYCRAKPYCREAATYLLLPVQMFRVPATKEAVLEAMPDLTLEELLFIWDRKSIIEKILYAVEARLKNMPPERLAEFGYELKPNAFRRKIVDPVSCFKLLSERQLIDSREFLSACEIAIGALEEIVLPRMAALEGKPKKAVVEKLKTLLAEVVESKRPAASLVKTTQQPKVEAHAKSKETIPDGR